jgi:predicted methyltransferase
LVAALAFTTALMAPSTRARAEPPDPTLKAAVDGQWRQPQNRARDAWRHPSESLIFWGLKPGMTLVEVDPGVRGWWTEILAPYARTTGGTYIAALPDRAQGAGGAEAQRLRARRSGRASATRSSSAT